MEKEKKGVLSKVSPRMLKYIPALTGVVVIIVFSLISGLTYYGYQESVSSAEKLKDEEAALEQTADNLDFLLNDYKKELARLETLLFKDRDIPLFLEAVSSRAAQFNVRINEMRVSAMSLVQSGQSSRQKDPADEGALVLAAMPFNIKISGAFFNIVNFLSSIEKERQILTLSDINIARRGRAEQLDCDFRLDIYSLRTRADLDKR